MAFVFPNLIDLWDVKKQWNNDAGRYEWDINLPEYQDGASCSDPSGSLTILGYAKAVITNVKKKDIQAEVRCEDFFDGTTNPNQAGGGAGRFSPYRFNQD